VDAANCFLMAIRSRISEARKCRRAAGVDHLRSDEGESTLLKKARKKEIDVLGFGCRRSVWLPQELQFIVCLTFATTPGKNLRMLELLKSWHSPGSCHPPTRFFFANR